MAQGKWQHQFTRVPGDAYFEVENPDFEGKRFRVHATPAFEGDTPTLDITTVGKFIFSAMMWATTAKVGDTKVYQLCGEENGSSMAHLGAGIHLERVS